MAPGGGLRTAGGLSLLSCAMVVCAWVSGWARTLKLKPTSVCDSLVVRRRTRILGAIEDSQVPAKPASQFEANSLGEL